MASYMGDIKEKTDNFSKVFASFRQSVDVVFFKGTETADQTILDIQVTAYSHFTTTQFLITFSRSSSLIRKNLQEKSPAQYNSFQMQLIKELYETKYYGFIIFFTRHEA